MDQNNPFDPNTLAQLQGLLGQMGPSDADKADANKRMWLSAGLGMMANSYKPPSMALGIGGQTGLQSYNDELTRLAQQRASSIGSSTQIMQLLQRTQCPTAIACQIERKAVRSAVTWAALFESFCRI